MDAYNLKLYISKHSSHTIQREVHLRCLVSKRLAGSLGFGKCATATQSPGNPNNGPLVKAAAIRRLQRSLGGEVTTDGRDVISH